MKGAKMIKEILILSFLTIQTTGCMEFDRKLSQKGSIEFFKNIFEIAPNTKLLFGAQTIKEHNDLVNKIKIESEKRRTKIKSKLENSEINIQEINKNFLLEYWLEKNAARQISTVIQYAKDFKLVIACIEQFKEKTGKLPLDRDGYIWRELEKCNLYREYKIKIGKKKNSRRYRDFPSILSLVNFASTGKFEIRDEGVVRSFLETKKEPLFKDWDVGSIRPAGKKEFISKIDYCLQTADIYKPLDFQKLVKKYENDSSPLNTRIIKLHPGERKEHNDCDFIIV